MTSSDFEIVLLKPNEVHVDRDHFVQRDFKEAHARKIAADYDPALFGIGYVSLRSDNRYYLMDGQHRCSAAIMAQRGEERVPFYVIRGLTIPEEAQRFKDLNAHKLNVDALSPFKTGVTARNPVNLEIAAILKNFGLTYGAGGSDGTVSAVATLLQIYAGRVGTKANAAPKAKSKIVQALPQSHLLTRTLTILTQAWGRDRNAFDGLLMKGIAALVYKHDAKVEGARMAKNLARYTNPIRAAGAIRALKESGRMTTVAAAVTVLEGLYNRSLSEDKKLK